MTARPPHDRSPEAVAVAFFEAFARRDVDALMQLVSDDIVEAVQGVGVMTGAADERAFLTGLFASFPDLATVVVRVTAAGRVVAVERVGRGTFTGRSWRGLPASGKPFESRGAAFFEVDGGRATRITVYSDTARFARCRCPSPGRLDGRALRTRDVPHSRASTASGARLRAAPREEAVT